MFFLTCHTRSSDDTGLAWWLDSGHSSGLLQDNRYLVNGQFPHRKCKQDKFIHIWTRTSGSCAGVQRQTCGSSPQDLLLGLGPLFLLVALFLSLGQAELEWGKEKQQETNSSSWLCQQSRLVLEHLVFVPLWRGWQAWWRWSSSMTTQTWWKRGGRRSGRQLEGNVKQSVRTNNSMHTPTCKIRLNTSKLPLMT